MPSLRARAASVCVDVTPRVELTESRGTGRYLNHSSEAANIVSVEGEEEGQFSTYRSTRLIRAGEELLTDYRDGLESMYARISSL